MKHSISKQIFTSDLFDQADQTVGKYREKLVKYQKLLAEWNKRVNLVSRDVSRETIWNHVRHSLLISGLESFKNARLIVDAGTGGGLPGIPLAITHPSKDWVLNDIVTKKVLAVKQMARKIGLRNTQIKNCPIVDLYIDKPFLLISKHAFKINVLYDYTKHLPWDAMIFYKSTKIKNELKDIDKNLNISIYDLSKHNNNSFYDGKGLIVVKR